MKTRSRCWLPALAFACAGATHAPAAETATPLTEWFCAGLVRAPDGTTPDSPGSALAGSINLVPRSTSERSRPVFNGSVTARSGLSG